MLIYSSSDIPLRVLKKMMKVTQNHKDEVSARYQYEVRKVVYNDELSARQRIHHIRGLTKYVPTDYLAGMTDKIVDLALKCGPNTSAGVLLEVRFNFQDKSDEFIGNVTHELTASPPGPEMHWRRGRSRPTG